MHKPPKGCPGRVVLRCRSVGAKRRLTKRVRGDLEKSGSRPSPADPRGAKPKGGAGGLRLKTPWFARQSREMRSQKPRSFGPVRRFGGGETAGLTVGGFILTERSG